MKLFELFATIGLDSSEFDKGVNDATNKGKSLSSSIGSGLATAAKVGGAAIAAAAAGVGALTKASLENYAQYEQLVGGVETLFKSNASTVLAYAENAYKTAGLSANQYMETVTSFSASLLQSLGGDTEAATKYADMAITDMSDNANKMGTSMEMIQNAYRGFAKSNYTMLDNLALGYGGTKEEMQRLLADAEKLSGQKFDLSSYADIVDAIHVVQTEMGITGTTAKEASTTIQGSVSSMKSAWQNLVTAFGDENANLDEYMGNFVDSIVTVGKNVIPRLQTILPRLVEGITGLANALIPMLPPIIETLLPSVVEGAIAIVNGVVAILPQILTVIAGAMPQVIDAMLTILPQLITAGLEIIVALSQGIIASLPQLFPAAIDAVMAIVDTLLDNIDLLIDTGIEFIFALTDGLIDALPKLIEKMPEIIVKIVKAIIDNLPKIILAGVQLILKLIEGIVKSIPDIIKAILQLISDLITTFKNTDWAKVGKDLIDEILSGLKQSWTNIKTWFTDAWDSLFGNRSVDVNAKVNDNRGINGSHANGLSYVPYDGYIAELHRGERVLTAAETRQMDKATSNQPIILDIDGHELARFLEPAMSTRLAFEG
jgi:phage-related protein